jgi:uncharacterized membrane protein
LIKHSNVIIFAPGEHGNDKEPRHFGRLGQACSRIRVHSESDVAARRIHEQLPAPQFDPLWRPKWLSVARLIVGSGGAAIAIAGFGQRSLPGLGLASGGLALLSRSICNVPFSHLLGLRTYADEGFLVWRTIRVDANVWETYRCWRELERFPQFMKNVRSVRQIDDTLYHWTVKGPGGVPVEWHAQITAEIPDELIAWHTLEGALVQSYGVVLFKPEGDAEATRIHLRMAYRPPGNVAGRLAAQLLGRNPNRQIDGDLRRFKAYLEGHQ